MTARFEIPSTADNFPLLYNLMQNSNIAPWKVNFEFFLYQTSIPLANINLEMVMTPPPTLLTLVIISETHPSSLSVNVIYTRPLIACMPICHICQDFLIKPLFFTWFLPGWLFSIILLLLYPKSILLWYSEHHRLTVPQLLTSLPGHLLSTITKQNFSLHD